MRRLTPNLVISILLHALLVLPFLWIFHTSDISSDKPLAGGQGVTVEVVGRDSIPAVSSGSSRPSSQPRARLASSSAQAGSGSGEDPGGTSLILADIHKRIESAKRYPEIARRSGIEGKSLVSFRINETGQPVEIALKGSSGSEILDQESLATVRRAAPFPNYENRLEINIRFSSKAEDKNQGR